MARCLALTFGALVAVVLVVQPALGQQPKRGGVIRMADREAPNLDPHLSISFLTHSWASMVYSQLVRYPHGPEQKHPADFSIVPDLAEKWEYKSPTVIEFTLKKGVKFHNKPPVNGREVTADDAKYSIERFMAKSAFRARFDVVQSVDVVDRYNKMLTTPMSLTRGRSASEAPPTSSTCDHTTRVAPTPAREVRTVCSRTA